MRANRIAVLKSELINTKKELRNLIAREERLEQARARIWHIILNKKRTPTSTSTTRVVTTTSATTKSDINILRSELFDTKVQLRKLWALLKTTTITTMNTTKLTKNML